MLCYTGHKSRITRCFLLNFLVGSARWSCSHGAHTAVLDSLLLRHATWCCSPILPKTGAKLQTRAAKAHTCWSWEPLAEIKEILCLVRFERVAILIIIIMVCIYLWWRLLSKGASSDENGWEKTKCRIDNAIWGVEKIKRSLADWCRTLACQLLVLMQQY